MSLVRSKKRVADHGEVFTPDWLVDAMLDLVKGESDRIDSRFLEPACGSGNFLVRVLARKLTVTERRYGKSEFEHRQYALLGLMCIYGVEPLADNAAECRQNMLDVFGLALGIDQSEDLYKAAASSATKHRPRQRENYGRQRGVSDYVRRMGLPRQRQVSAAGLSI